MPWSGQKDYKQQDSSWVKTVKGGTNRFAQYSNSFKQNVKDPEFKKKMQEYREYVRQAAETKEDGYNQGDDVLPDTLFSLVKDAKELIKHNVKSKVKERRQDSKERKEREEKRKVKQTAKQGVQPSGAIEATTPPEGEKPPKPEA